MRSSIPLISNFASVYAIRKLQENQVELKLNWTHQLLVSADNVNHMGYNRYHKGTQRKFN
jgi:hypothetical protein